MFLGSNINAETINFESKSSGISLYYCSIPHTFGLIRKQDHFQCMRDLRSNGTDPEDDKTRIENSKDQLIKESYAWILNDRDFQGWYSNKDKRILRITGDPGKGK